ncbi:MAG: metallophosphoesterase [Clostridia bacterium]|nr:metallophosphoesterase [Clostridia bacterium]
MKIHIPRWVGIALLCAVLPGLFNGLKTAHYRLDAGASPEEMRIVFLSDLHDCAWGEDMDGLLSAVDGQRPDLILLGGDLFGDGPSSENTVRFLEGIAGRYPCYYVTGNHEYAGGAEAFAARMAVLEGLHIRRLSGEMAEIEWKGVHLNLCGVDDPAAWAGGFDPAAAGWASFEEQLEHVSALPRRDGYTILLSHRPEKFDLYCAYGFDLVLAGHAHGGQWAVPGLLNGVYAPGQGYFPKYAGGRFDKDGTVMIVGRGLVRASGRLPRFYNPPEIVVVTLK